MVNPVERCDIVLDALLVKSLKAHVTGAIGRIPGAVDRRSARVPRVPHELPLINAAIACAAKQMGQAFDDGGSALRYPSLAWFSTPPARRIPRWRAETSNLVIISLPLRSTGISVPPSFTAFLTSEMTTASPAAMVL